MATVGTKPHFSDGDGAGAVLRAARAAGAHPSRVRLFVSPSFHKSLLDTVTINSLVLDLRNKIGNLYLNMFKHIDILMLRCDCSEALLLVFLVSSQSGVRMMNKITAVSMTVFLIAGVTACSGKDREESYMSVINQDGKEILVSEHMHKWQCEAHGRNIVTQFQAPHNQLVKSVFSYECVPKSEFK